MVELELQVICFDTSSKAIKESKQTHWRPAHMYRFFPSQPLRIKDVAIPTTIPTAVTAIPTPITPSAYIKEKSKWRFKLMRRESTIMCLFTFHYTVLYSRFKRLSLSPLWFHLKSIDENINNNKIFSTIHE